jgi:hypothetical protein
MCTVVCMNTCAPEGMYSVSKRDVYTQHFTRYFKLFSQVPQEREIHFFGPFLNINIIHCII